MLVLSVSIEAFGWIVGCARKQWDSCISIMVEAAAFLL